MTKQYAAPEAVATFMRPELPKKTMMQPSLDTYSFAIVMIQMLYLEENPRLGDKVASRLHDSHTILFSNYCVPVLRKRSLVVVVLVVLWLLLVMVVIEVVVVMFGLVAVRFEAPTSSFCAPFADPWAARGQAKKAILDYERLPHNARRSLEPIAPHD